ncbi:MAG: hypothetical protein NT099_06005 [Candidatus Saganbacteria bacterium]|nr:hypothetical protein [Candidatus Saganbacteria bacterium]
MIAWRSTIGTVNFNALVAGNAIGRQATGQERAAAAQKAGNALGEFLLGDEGEDTVRRDYEAPSFAKGVKTTIRTETFKIPLLVSLLQGCIELAKGNTSSFFEWLAHPLTASKPLTIYKKAREEVVGKGPAPDKQPEEPKTRVVPTGKGPAGPETTLLEPEYRRIIAAA